MTTEVEFFWGGQYSPYWSTFWPQGELKTFRDRDAVRIFCERQGIEPRFTGNPDGVEP